MRISQYVAGWSLIKQNFDIKEYLDNAFYYVDEVSVALNTSEDNSLEILNKYKNDTGRNLIITETNFSYDDPFCYGNIVNSALQVCSGDILCLRDFDEYNGGNIEQFKAAAASLNEDNHYQAIFLPVIDLFGDLYHYNKLGFKWFMHKRGLYRGAVNFGLKENGRPDYNKTSTDELIDKDGNLVKTINLVEYIAATLNQTINNEFILKYMKSGHPFVYHVGYVNFENRLKRNNEFWIDFWTKATGGDGNNHATKIEDLNKREVFEHGLSLWNKIEDTVYES